MERLKNLSEIDTNTKEGRYLLAAIAILTTQPTLRLHGVEMIGAQMTPDQMLDEVNTLVQDMYKNAAPIHDGIPEERLTFQEAIERTINKYSKENGSNTPDFILAKFLSDMLDSFDHAVNQRHQWHREEIDSTKGCSEVQPQ